MGDVQPFNSLTSGTNAMQLKKLSPLAGLLLTALLGACGGGGDDEPPPPAPPPPPAAVIASSATISSTPLSIVNKSLQFGGGACSGGTPPYAAATWNYGDSQQGTSNTHTYTNAGTYSVTVTCTDSKNVTATSSPFNVDVKSKAYEGFLGRTWSTYAAIDSTNSYIYPVAGIANDAGDIYSVWLRSALLGNGQYASVTDVAAGSSNVNTSVWTAATDPLWADQNNTATFNGTGYEPTAAAIDMAIAPNGKAVAAWRTVVNGSGPTPPASLYYATKDGSNPWSTPVLVTGIPTTGVGSIQDATIKVVVSKLGDVAAIGYCATGANSTRKAAVVVTTGPSSNSTPQVVSEQCDDPVSFANTQRSRAFDIAFDASSNVTAVGLTNSTPTGNFYVSLSTFQSGSWTTATHLSDELTTTGTTPKMPTSDFSLSYARSPDGTVAGVAWTQAGVTTDIRYPATRLNNVLVKILANGAWLPANGGTAVQPLTTFEFVKPLIAVNDDGQAFLAMEGDTPPPVSNPPFWVRTYRTYVTSYSPLTTPPANPWSAIVSTDVDAVLSNNYRLNATDIAIDKWGTGLITRFNSNRTQAGTLPAGGTWSGFASIPSNSAGYRNFHYQTMRALPDGRAVLVTSVTKGTGNLQSGSIVLK